MKIMKQFPAHLGTHMLILCSTILVSTSFVVGEIVATQIDPAILTLVRFLLAALILGTVLFMRSELSFSQSLFWRSSVISGCLVIFFWSMFLALRYTTALHTSVIFALTPLFSAIYTLMIFRNTFSVTRFLVLLYGGVGALWVIFRGDWSLATTLSWNRGDLIFLGGCAAMGLYAPLIKVVRRRESTQLMTFWILVTGSMWLLIFSGPKLVHFQWNSVPLSCWWWTMYLAIFCTVITFYLVQLSVPRLGPVQVTAYGYLYPALVLIIDLIRGSGLPHTSVLPGVVIVVSAMFFLARES